ncbi:MAG: hypothetical protein J6Y03_02360 [Alphaproteobacteria bacterium]|nr:hypothetical protein [Alphaproteobacteria bacterium]
MKKVFYQICAAFIFNKRKRKNFRQKHITPLKKSTVDYKYNLLLESLNKTLFNKLTELEERIKLMENSLSLKLPVDYRTLNRLMQLNLSTALLHQKTFLPFKNKHQGKDIVIVATGPSARKYKPILNAIHIGVNRAIDVGVDLDYLFIQDYSGSKEYLPRIDKYRKGKCIKFYGLTTEYESQFHRVIPESNAVIADALRYRTDWVDIPYFEPQFAYDISTKPLGCFGSIVFPALQFALWTNPKRIYLVGCDCTSGVGYFDKQETGGNSLTDTIIDTYKKFKDFAHIYYPDIEIISVNPVGLKGIFKDIEGEYNYQKNI